MKCTMCSGEVDSQAINCPFCGARNEEGIAFNKEVLKRIQRNKLLAPVVLKQETPELISKMLTRINIGFLGIGFVFLLLYLLIFTWAEREPDRMPKAGSRAEQYMEQPIHDDNKNSGYESWRQYADRFIDAWDSGMPIDWYLIRSLIRETSELYRDSWMSEEMQKEAIKDAEALFLGILGFSDEEMLLLQGERQYQYESDYGYLTKENGDALMKKIAEKLGDQLEGWEGGAP